VPVGAIPLHPRQEILGKPEILSCVLGAPKGWLHDALNVHVFAIC
jgi:hypothetical protein